MKKVKIIEKCPECSSNLVREKDQLFCRNKNCTATMFKRVMQFVKSMKIKGLGEKTVEKLDIRNYADIYNLNKDEVVSVIGEKLTDKLFVEIEQSKQTSLEKFLPAMSIQLIGGTAARKINRKCTHPDDITFDICKEVGLGDKAAIYLVDFIEETWPSLKDLPLSFEANTSSSESRNIKICITGKLNDYRSRGLASSFLESQGFTVVSGVSKTLDYLINEDNKPSSKLSKANEYNIPIVSIKQLLEEINK